MRNGDEAMITEIQCCRVCGSKDVLPVLDLGNQALTGWFPKSLDEEVPRAPLQLVRCDDSRPGNCGLLQLKHSVDSHLIYGDRYGYRSGLNVSMTRHISQMVSQLRRRTLFNDGDVILDIGSNDGTLLGNFEKHRFRLIGIDPTATKFGQFYRSDIQIIPEFFDKILVENVLGGQKVKLITALSMFYDLESPMQFLSDVRDLLDAEGLLFIEQCYMPLMIERTAYDTICHEHLEYYRLKQIKWMADRVGLRIVDVEFNDVNGGSIGVLFARSEAPFEDASIKVERILRQEIEAGYCADQVYANFQCDVECHRDQLRETLISLRKEGREIVGYGASTKGNVLLQYCQINSDYVSSILEVNADKFGCYTPGTGIPIENESALELMRPDYLLVLPWHFKDMILAKEHNYLKGGGRMIFPLPKVNVSVMNHNVTEKVSG